MEILSRENKSVYVAKDARFRVIHHSENLGLSAARNTGIAHATADYLMFVDSDDWVHVDFCRLPYECVIQYYADLVMFNYKRIKKATDDQSIIVNTNKHDKSGYISREEGLALLQSNVGPMTWNKLYKTDFFNAIFFPEGYYCEDIGTTYKVVWKASRIYSLDKILSR